MRSLFKRKAFALKWMHWQWSPSWFMLLGFFLVLFLFLTLRQWQLDRAIEKTEQLQRIQSQLQQPPHRIDLTQLSSEKLQALRYHRVRLQGRWLNDRALLQDNVTRAGVSGFNVLVPFLLEGGQLILADLGWQAWGGSKVIPAMKLPQGNAWIEGQIAPALKRFTLSDEMELGWPKVIQSVDYAVLAAQFTYPIIPSLLLVNQPETAFEQQRTLVYGDPNKHRAYALQWTLFAIILCILFIGLNLKRLDR